MFDFLKTLFGNTTNPAPAEASTPSLAIEPDRAMIAAESRAMSELFADVEARLMRSAVFKQEQVPGLMAKLRATNRAFGRSNVENAIAGDTYLSTDEKRTLGLNTRMKYSHAFIAMCTPDALKTIEPKSHLEQLYAAAYWTAQRTKQLSEFRRIGVVLRVRIVPGVADGMCALANSRKTYQLDLAPTLPHPKCKSECCSCTFEASKLVP